MSAAQRGAARRRLALASALGGAGLLLAVSAILSAGDPSDSAGAFDEIEFRPAHPHVQTGSDRLTITTLSARSDMVTGGDVLVRVDVAPGIDPASVSIERNGADVTALFRPAPDGRALLGLVTGLSAGENRLLARSAGRRAALVVTNHPVWGPVFAGPHEQPYYCTTHLFRLVTGELLGPALDEHCSAPTRVDYVYRSTAGTIEPLPRGGGRPADLTFTTTSEGRQVPFIVRVETGTINRAIYEIALLHDPAGPVPDPATRSPGWNGRLIYRYGGGCRPGWYQQGSATGGVLDDAQLSRGYAIASSTLNVFANNCSELLSAETTMMVKERFVEAYGAPLFTVGWGSSGGSHQAFGIADNYPGLLDGLVVGSSFPDMTSGTVFKSVDGRLLEHYFAEVAPGRFSDEQQRAISGFGVLASIPAMSFMARRSDPTADFADVVPVEARYHPVENPTGARATIYDHAVSVYGRDPRTGFARRPLDNVGVQYGLATLNAGVIDVDRFLDLNEGIGGLDLDFRHQPERTEADPLVVRAAYRTGRIISGAGLASVPIVDYRAYLDLREDGDNHMKLHSFSLRDRLVRTNGHAENHVLLVRDAEHRFGFGSGYSSTGKNDVLYEALAKMDRWLTSIAADPSDDPLPAKVVRARPADLADACWTPEGVKIEEPQSYDGPGACGVLYPSFPVPAMVAGGRLADDVVKCQLKPLDRADYSVPFDAARWSRLERIFPTGVCDWTRPGVEQQPQAGMWLAARRR